jgi:hypothetical protein
LVWWQQFRGKPSLLLSTLIHRDVFRKDAILPGHISVRYENSSSRNHDRIRIDDSCRLIIVENLMWTQSAGEIGKRSNWIRRGTTRGACSINLVRAMNHLSDCADSETMTIASPFLTDGDFDEAVRRQEPHLCNSASSKVKNEAPLSRFIPGLCGLMWTVISIPEARREPV